MWWALLTDKSAKLKKWKKKKILFTSIDENLPENYANSRNMFSMKSGQVDPWKITDTTDMIRAIIGVDWQLLCCDLELQFFFSQMLRYTWHGHEKYLNCQNFMQCITYLDGPHAPKCCLFFTFLCFDLWPKSNQFTCIPSLSTPHKFHEIHSPHFQILHT